ncbi:MAG: hypothetical protein Q9213_004154 [Squamulea squamosa]
MPKRSIADFFKPFAFARNSQPLRVDDEVENPRPPRRSRSVTPLSDIQALAGKTTDAANRVPEASSQSSVLSSLRGSTPNAPEEHLTYSLELPTVTRGATTSGQTLGDSFTGSQTTIIPSSQRVIRNGKVVIKDSDDERSNSDLSLEDLDDLIAPPKPSTISSPPPQNRIPSYQPLGARCSADIKPTHKRKCGSGNASTNEQTAAATNLPSYKFSLDALIKHNQKYESSRESIQDVAQLLEDLDEQKLVGKVDPNTALDIDLLASVIKKNDDDTDMGRLMAAIERTEALHQEERWSFFTTNHEPMEIAPEDCPPVADQYWQSVLGDPFTRQQAFLSGYVGECASFRKLPNELLAWLLDAACCEERNDLRFSYCQTLGVLESQVTNCMTTSTVNKIFKRIGARLEALDLNKAIVPSTAMSNDHNLLHIIHDVISKVLESVEGDVGEETITQHLNQPRFVISSETDYPDLAAAIAILAIGLDNGDPPLVEASKEAITAFNDDLDMLAQRIKVLFTQIIASGASHMKRNEAKDVLESFYTCLVHAVRTKQRPKGMMWEDDVGVEKQKSLMKHFVQRDKAGSIMQF